jgi:two-component system phosphate regulon sensor histidine kinase PhoR
VWIRADTLTDACKVEAFALKNTLGSYDYRGQQDVGRRIQKADLSFEIQPDLELAGSQTELLSAMCNLVNNAIRYTPANGKIRVSFQAMDRGGAVFSVNDTGLGIPSEHLSRLTQRFYRVDASRSRETGGTGLGLSIVKHVVQRHDGELQISSTLGRGSTFCFTLPAYRVRFQKNSVAS